MVDANSSFEKVTEEINRAREEQGERQLTDNQILSVIEQSAEIFNVDEILEKLTEISESEAVESVEEEIFSFPPGVEPSTATLLRQDELAPVMPPGLNNVLFDKGVVDLADNTELEFRRSLGDIGPDYIQNLTIDADDIIGWWVPNQRAGGILKQSDTLTLKGGSSKGLDITEIIIATPRMCEVNMYASTNGDPTFNISRDKGILRRASYDPVNGIPFITVENEEFEDTPIPFIPEVAAQRENAIASPNIFGEAVTNLGLVIKNNGDNPVDISIEVSEDAIPLGDIDKEGLTPIEQVGVPEEFINYAELSGWTRDNPQTIDANSSESFTISPWDHSNLRMHPRAPEGETNIFVAVTGRF